MRERFAGIGMSPQPASDENDGRVAWEVFCVFWLDSPLLALVHFPGGLYLLSPLSFIGGCCRALLPSLLQPHRYTTIGMVSQNYDMKRSN